MQEADHNRENFYVRRRYEALRAKAIKKGWVRPEFIGESDIQRQQEWIQYWESTMADKAAEDPGRPVVPHLSGGVRRLS